MAVVYTVECCPKRSGLKDIPCSPNENTQGITVNHSAQSQHRRKPQYYRARGAPSKGPLPTASFSLTVLRSLSVHSNGQPVENQSERVLLDSCSFIPLQRGELAQIKMLSGLNNVRWSKNNDIIRQPADEVNHR